MLCTIPRATRGRNNTPNIVRNQYAGHFSESLASLRYQKLALS